MKAGDILICIDDHNKSAYITKGNQYIVNNKYEGENSFNTIPILDDNNNFSFYKRNMFITLSEYREKQLDKILD